MTGLADNMTFSLGLLQAINDWQKSSNDKRGNALKEHTSSVAQKFRTCSQCCFRQIALDKRSVWDLLAESELKEKISSWTVDLQVAKTLKGGVPPKGQGWQGVIFIVKPQPEQVIINLSSLYQDKDFNTAIVYHENEINNFGDGIERYRNTQAEVVLEIPDLSRVDIYALGGFSSDKNELARLFYGKSPTSDELQQFERELEQSGEKLGPGWVEGESVNRIVERMRPRIEELKAIKTEQMKRGV